MKQNNRLNEANAYVYKRFSQYLSMYIMYILGMSSQLGKRLFGMDRSVEKI